ncbi:MAG TPA: YdcF family protein, partial [Vicinamibacterales bacterium]|nr:YdcF family protein [Vicinamibacterales bacterium]
MNPFVEFIKEFLIPGSTWFFLIVATVSVLLLFGSEGKRRIARVLLATLVVVYWVISVPVIAHALQSARGRPSEPTSTLPPQPLPIIVLGNGIEGYAALGGRIETPGGRTAMNTLFALDRFRSYPDSMVIASGGIDPAVHGGYPEGAVIRDALIRNNVPPDHIIVEGGSRTTREQAVESTRILKQLGASTCIVVTSPQQMAR